MPVGEISYFVFRTVKRKSLCDDFAWEEVSDFEEERPHYRSHLTRTFRHNEILLRATQIKLTRRYNNFFERGLSIEEFMKTNEKIGKRYSSDPTKCKLVYMILDDSLYISDEESQGGRRFGGCFLTYKDATFKTDFYLEPVDDMSLKRTQRDFHFFGFLETPQRFPEETDYKLRADYIKPGWFDQHNHDKILLPGTQIADSIRLKLTVPKGMASRELKVEMEVELVHLWSESVPKSPFRRNEYLQHCVDAALMVSRKAYLFSPKDRGIIPKSLYDFKLPSVGPTFYTAFMRGSYALRFVVKIKEKRITRYCQTAINVNIAVLAKSACKMLQQTVDRNSVQVAMTEHTYFCHLGIQSHLDDEPSQARMEFLKRLRKHKVKIQLHEAVGVRCLDLVVSLTVMKCQVPNCLKNLNVEWLKQMRCLYDSVPFGYEPPEVKPNEAIVYKAFTMGKSRLFAGAIFLLEGDAFLTEFPLSHMPNLPKTTDNRMKINENGALYITGPGGVKLHLQMKFVINRYIAQEEGEYITIPNSNLSSCFEWGLLLHREMPLQEKKVSPSFTVRMIEVHLLEKLHITAQEAELLPLVPFETTRCLKLLERRFRTNLTWAREAAVTDQQSSILIPKQIYECLLPNIGPTFFTNSQTRMYFVKVRMCIESLDGTWRGEVEALHKVNIASPPGEKARGNEKPPPYVAFATWYPRMYQDTTGETHVLF